MTAISGAIPNLIGGVSQQPREIRAPNSAERLLNTTCDVAIGLTTRPNALLQAIVGDAPASNYTLATHVIQKPSGNFQITAFNGAVHVTNLTTGVTSSVTLEGSSAAYLAGSEDLENVLDFLTIGDTTFVYNKAKTVLATTIAESGVSGVTEDGVVRKSPNRHSTLWVRQRAGYNANYGLYVNGVQKANVVTDTETPSSIAESIVTEATTNGITLSRLEGSVVSVTHPNDTSYITSHDDLANTAIFAYNDEVTEFTKLPNSDVEGRLVLITQSEDGAEDDYWVWYKKGSWQETYGWGAYEVPQASTMPHIIVDNGDGTWTMKPHVWPGREVGDKDSNASPTFINKTINRLFLYRGRMVILSDENFIASQVGNYENFYRSTCTQLLDDDRIDIASPNSRGSFLHTGEEFDGKLLLSSNFDQFVVDSSADDVLSPNTVTIKKVNSYHMSGAVSPVSIGPNFIFVDDFQNRGHALLREYQVERVFGRQVALSVTDQVPEYIPTGVYQMAASASDDILAVVSKGNRSSLWLYNYYFNNEGKVLSSWQEWTFPFTVYGVSFLDDLLLMTAVYNGKIAIVSFSFDSGVDEILDSGDVLLDLGVASSGATLAYDGTNTIVTLPYALASDADLALYRGVVTPDNPGTLKGGRVFKPTARSGADITFANVDLTGNDLVFGFAFRFYWKLNPIYVRDRNLVAIQDGRLQLRNVSFLFNNSGPFDVLVTPLGRDTYRDRYTGIFVGAQSTPLDKLNIGSGEFRSAAYGEGDKVGIEVEAYTPWRVRFSSLEWDGAYRGRKKRTT